MEDQKEGKYIYCIIKHAAPLEYGPIGIGKRGDLVYAVNYKDISAIVSNSPVNDYEARRIYISAHQKVLEEVMKDFTILPVRFSTITESDQDAEIVNILTREYEKFRDLLEQMEGKKELGLKAIAKEETIFMHIIEKYNHIKTLRDQLAKLPPDKTHYQRMKIGEMVASALEEEKEIFKNELLDSLTPLAEGIKINDNYGERMIINAAFLIKNGNESEFDQVIENLDKRIGNLVTFKYVGTLPPYNFVNLVIETKGN